MTNKKSTTTPASALFAEWRNDPEYVRAYEALDEEFSLAAAMIAARSHAGLTQKELAERMGTTQSVVARLEGGNSRPSTATLDKFAQATETRLRISFEPDARPS
jgi:ribosome-binding protein aMBF1 (putative translation factor)